MHIDPNVIADVKGFLDPDEGKMLYETALEACQMGPCLEIGSYCGKSALYLGAACRKSDTVLFSVDHHRGSEEQQPGEEYFDPELFDMQTGRIDTSRTFRHTLSKAKLEDSVIPIINKSEIVARFWATPLSLVFIDGGHAFETAYTDYTCWVNHIMPKGYLLIHDIFERPEDGGQAPYNVYTIARSSGLFKELPRVKSLGILKRLDCGEIAESIRLQFL